MRKFITILLLPPLALISAYLALSALLMLFPAGDKLAAHYQPPPAILLTHDLAHVNLVIDLAQSSVPWHTLVPEIVPQMQGFLLVGWGDRQTYIQTPQWSDLTASVAIQALLLDTPSALHLHYLPDLDNLVVQVTPLWTPQSVNRRIEANILSTFTTPAGEPASRPVLLAAGYGVADRFYHSRGSYHLLHTCNNWIGDILQRSGVPVSRWTPLSYNVIYSIPAHLRTRP